MGSLVKLGKRYVRLANVQATGISKMLDLHKHKRKNKCVKSINAKKAQNK